MTLCVKTGYQCSCQPDEGMFCPDYKPDWYVQCLMDAILELRKSLRPEAACPHIRSSDEGTYYCALAARPEVAPTIPRADEIRLACGELTVGEMKAAKAVLQWFINTRCQPQSQAHQEGK